MLPATYQSDDTPTDISMPALIARLAKLPLEDLRTRWRLSHAGIRLPERLSRDLMIRGIAWEEQGSRYGGLPQATMRLLDKMAAQLDISGTLDIERSVRPKTGTRILREWRGGTYVVEVADNCFLYDGQTFASLSHVARAITGTRWSGPRFFGLKPPEVPGAEGAG
jgi:hypothetical protein